MNGASMTCESMDCASRTNTALLNRQIKHLWVLLTKGVRESMLGYWSLFFLVGRCMKDSLKGSIYDKFSRCSPQRWFSHIYPFILTAPFLPQMFINNLNQAIKFCKIHNFADDTNLLCLSNSIKKLSKKVNADLICLVNWLNASKISQNVKKKLKR